MMWAASLLLVAGVLAAVLLPLLTRGAAPSVQKALDEQKRKVADELMALTERKAAGKIAPEEAAAQQKSLETQALALIEAARSAAPELAAGKDRGRVKMLAAVIAFVVLADAAAILFLYKGGWRYFANTAPATEAQQAPAEGAPPAGGQGMPNPAEMVARLEKKLAENPRNPEGWAMLARSYGFLKRNADAVKAWEKAIKLEPGNTNYKEGLAAAQQLAGGGLEKEEARVKENPSDPGAWVELARAYGFSQRFDDAVKAWAKAGELEPNNIDTKLGLARAYLQTDRLEESGKVYDSILAMDPNYDHALWGKAIVLARQGKMSEAEAIWKKLVSVVPPEKKTAMQEEINQLKQQIKESAGR